VRPVSNSLYPLIRDPSEVQDFGQHDVGIRAAINPLWIGIIALFMLIFVIVGAALSTDDLIKVLRSASGKLRALNMDSVTLYMVIAASSVVLVSLAVVIFERAKGMFLFLFLASFGVSDAMLPGVSEGSLVLRYLFMLVLIALAVVQSITSQRSKLEAIQWLGLAYLAWQLSGLLVNGYTAMSLLLFPVQFAVFWGILVGCREEFITSADYRRFCHALCWVGIGMTFFHASALIISPNPFLAGRFRSYYLLPTNFANGYALCFVGILWAALRNAEGLITYVARFSVPIGGGLLVLSGTRNAIFVVLVATTILAAVWTKRLILLGVVFVVGGAVFFGTYTENPIHQMDGLGDRFAKLESSTREEVWALAWHYILQRPILGYGIGKAGDVLGQTLQIWEKAEYINTHNLYLGILLQHGIIGLFLVGFMMVSTLWKGVNSLISPRLSCESKQLLVLPLAILSGLIAGGMFEEYLSSRGSIQQILLGFSVLLIITFRRVHEHMDEATVI